mmetsp:Transcript_11068/g.12445  ORF Transcript_11068/g.12445 Transcript_11068/m.12445 type:complete len:124 (+) Transcript_11068:149-520(+)
MSYGSETPIKHDLNQPFSNLFLNCQNNLGLGNFTDVVECNGVTGFDKVTALACNSRIQEDRIILSQNISNERFQNKLNNFEEFGEQVQNHQLCAPAELLKIKEAYCFCGKDDFKMPSSKAARI